MDIDRAKEIICSLLYHICNYTDIAEGGVVNYFSWLSNEVGLSIDEIHELQSMDNFIMPPILNKNINELRDQINDPDLKDLFDLGIPYKDLKLYK